MNGNWLSGKILRRQVIKIESVQLPLAVLKAGINFSLFSISAAQNILIGFIKCFYAFYPKNNIRMKNRRRDLSFN